MRRWSGRDKISVLYLSEDHCESSMDDLKVRRSGLHGGPLPTSTYNNNKNLQRTTHAPPSRVGNSMLLHPINNKKKHIFLSLFPLSGVFILRLLCPLGRLLEFEMNGVWLLLFRGCVMKNCALDRDIFFSRPSINGQKLPLLMIFINNRVGWIKQEYVNV